MKRNKFSKALKHLKSKKIDDKIKSLEEAGPTNSMSGVYQVTPDTGDGFRMGPGDPEKKFYPKADGTWPSGIPANASDTVYIRKGGYFDSGKGVVPHNQTPVSRDFSYDDVTANGTTNTNTLIRPSDGKPYTALPEGTESFILGPLVGNYAVNHGYDDYTNIGYIQKDTRQFVLLATIQGFFKGEDRPRTSYGGGNARTFDGTASQFTSYNSNFKLEHALWMLDRYNKNDFANNFPFNFSGGVPVERHPENNSMGMGVIMGILNALFGGDSDNIGTPQDPPDGKPGFDPGEMDLWGQNYDTANPKPKKEDYPNVRSYRRALARWLKDKTAAEQEFINQQSQNQGPILPDDPSGESPTEQNFFSNLKSKVNQAIKVVDTTLDYAERILGSLKNKLPQKNIADFISDAVMGANSGSAYNTQLAASLFNNIITGQNTRIKIGAEGRNSMVNSLDASALEKALVLGPPPETSADNAIRPGKKIDGVLKGRWGDQGGSEFHYNPENGTFTITSVKMLRQFEGDNKFGPGANFEDIPDQTSESVNNLINKIPGAEKTLRTFFNVLAAGMGDDAKTNIAGQEISNKDNETLAGRLFGSSEENKIVVDNIMRTFPKHVAAMSNFIIEGSASNAVLLRQALTSLGLPKTQAEKEGAGYGGYTYSQEVFTGSELPKEVRQAIINKYTSVDSAWSNIKAESFTGDRKRILREVRQPLREIQELPKTTKLKGYRPNFKGKFSPQNTPDVTASKKSDDIVSGKNASRQIWTAKDKYWKGYETTERMNIIYDNLGHGSQYFDRIVGENVRLKNKKSREVQEHLNMLAHQKALREVYGIKEYKDIIDESETYDNKINDPLFTKVAKRLKKEIDYPKKPSPKGYPNEAPPKIDPNTGMHPKFGKRYKYDKLDPQSAEGMPMQGDSEIDANIQKATDSKRKARKIKNLLGK